LTTNTSLTAPDVRAREGFDPQLFEVLASLEPQNFWFKCRNRLILWCLERFSPQLRSFLEIGCGTAYVLSAIVEHYPNARIAGSDLFPEALDYARRRVPRAEIFELDAKHIPFTSKYQAIGMFDVLEHIDDDVRVLEQVRNALEPDGMLYLTVPQHPWLWSPADDVAHHQRRYRAGELFRKLELCGFRVVFSTSIVSLLLPLLLVSRLRQRWFPSTYSVLSELAIDGPVGAICELVLRLEIACLHLGWRWPCGSTLAVVAAKQ